MTIYNFFLTKNLDVEVSITDRPDCIFIATRDCNTVEMMFYLEIMQATADAVGEHEIIKATETNEKVANAIIAHSNKTDRDLN